MEQWETFRAVCRAMADPAFYPHAVQAVERRDTHISAVFLTGAWVYKLKKPVDFGFLDFRRLGDRRRYCEREVQLNQRLSCGVYQGVISIVERHDGRLCLEGPGRVAEYAVKMRQLADGASLRQRLLRGEVSQDELHALGKKLVFFYKNSPKSKEIDHYGSVGVIGSNMEENFRQLQPYVGDIVDRQRWDFVCQVSRSFFKHHESLFDRRVRAGKICDGHGDLRSDHVYFDQGIQIIDCIEFNDRFRYGDAALDLAFLHMDLEHLGCWASSRILLATYAAEADDPALYGLIDFYATYRAVVKLKITCFRYAQEGATERPALAEAARSYLRQAYRYAIQFGRPTIWIVFGLPASGKSTLAGALCDILSMPWLQSDQVRKEKLSLSGPTVVPFGQGPYRPELRHHVYAELLALAHDALKRGRSPVIDATFSRRKWRDAARLLADDLDANIIFVECVCKEDTIRSRLESRQTDPGLSDARVSHFPRMLEDFEPTDELPAALHVKIDTDQGMDKALSRLLSEGFDRKRQQVAELLRS